MSVFTEQETLTRSKQLLTRAQACIPGGVNSPVRAYHAVGGTPRFIRSAQGAYVIDEDSRHYIDYVGSWGPMILGHAHPTVVHAVQQAAQTGLSFGAPCELEVMLAEKICRLMPTIQKVRMVNSGTEATMAVIRLARAVTGRNKILKFEGCYHGHTDALLVKAGSGALTFGVPSSSGIPEACIADTLIATYNDLDSVVSLFEAQGHDVAAIILEPIAGNMNLLMPEPGFIEGLRDICNQYNSLLIFDEVMTGFRVSPGGFQGISDIKPDLTTLGKIIGGGLPVGAFGGRADLMAELSPQGSVYQAGTLSGNPLAMAAGLATLIELEQPGCYDHLLAMTQQLVDGFLERAKEAGIKLVVHYCCGMFGFFFTKETEISRYKQAIACDSRRFSRFFHGMLQAGVYLAPSAFEAGFISLAHGLREIEHTLNATERVFARLE